MTLRVRSDLERDGYVIRTERFGHDEEFRDLDPMLFCRLKHRDDRADDIEIGPSDSFDCFFCDPRRRHGVERFAQTNFELRLLISRPWNTCE